ncbi:MAG: UDP-glucose pyrophosphorylase [Acidimicrobiia bacterium]|nr:UDP-glucose pyrophosphorylase [Acidimicrobiia bacterium]
MVRKAVIPAAGLGTRFLPATKATPKEMLPLVDKPGIQYVVEEAVGAGITDILIVTGRSKKTVEDHFDYAPELEAVLERSGKHEQAALVRSLAEMAEIHFVRQGTAKGLGHAVGMARAHVGNEPFAVLLPDDIMDPAATLLADMIAVTNRTGSSCIALKQIPGADISLYGSVAFDPPEAGSPVRRLTAMVEKPKLADAPSDLGIMGRYVLTPEVFDCIDNLAPGAGGELQLTDAMQGLLKQQDFYGLVFETGRYDLGNKLDWLRATVEVALGHPELGADFRIALAEICRREGI